MKFLCLTLACVSLLLPSLLFAEKAPAAGLKIHVDSFHLVHVGQDRADAELNLSVETDIDGHFEHIDFGNIQANGVPFFAQPIDTPIEVHRGESLRLPPISVTAYTGDLDSLEPLISILDDQQTHLQAELRIRVQATTLQHLLLGDAHPLAVLSIDQDVEVQAPGGFLGRASGLALLKAAQIAISGAGHLPLRLSSTDPAWQLQLDIARSALLHARSCYAFEPKKAASNEVCVDQLAFALGPQDAISSAELGMPWRFDPQLARAFADHGSRLITGDPRITLQHLDPAAPNASGASPATFQQVGDAAATRVILLPGRSRLSLLNRDSPGLYGRLHMAQAAAAFHRSTGQASGERIAIFRLAHTAEGEWLPRVIYLSGTLTGQTITFSRPVDRSAIGSPILTPQGVVGVVQTENGGTLLAAEPTPM